MERCRNRAAIASEQRRLELTSLGTLIGVDLRGLGVAPDSIC